MTIKRFITPIKISTKKPKYRASTGLESQKVLESFLKRYYVNVSIVERLHGGVDSDVYSANINQKRVVIKHTEDRSLSLFKPPFSPIDYFVPRENLNLDTYILKYLHNSKVRVPEVIKYFRNSQVSLLEDLRNIGGELLLDRIIENKLKLESARYLAEQLYQVNQELQKIKKLKVYKTTEGQIFERGLELRLYYPNDQKHYIRLEKTFLKNSTQLIWPDGHPKNIFIFKDNSVAFIDFGGCIHGDPRFVLPNFVGQFIVYFLGGYLEKEFVMKYLNIILNTYRKNEVIYPQLFVEYLGMEILHRSNGKWLMGINSKKQKLKCIDFGLSIFDQNIKDIKSLFQLITKY